MSHHPFDSLLELETPHIRLDCAALHLARDAYPNANLQPYLEWLDRIAADVADVRPGLAATMRYQAMREVIVQAWEFRGDERDYYNPENNYLNRVLERTVGIPISLSIIWLEVARRLKWPVSGLGFPGHFLLRIDDPDRFIIVDPFRDGRTLRVDDCQRVLDHCFDQKLKFEEKFLAPVDTRVILARMLNNLRGIYLAHQDWSRLEQVLRRLIAVEPTEGRHLQELATVQYRLGRVQNAHAMLSAYVRERPTAEDGPLVMKRLKHLSRALAALN